MNNYKEDFIKNKEDVILLLEKAKEFCDIADKKIDKERFEELSNAVKEGEFSIVVVGEFSAGKSTFLNALMGENMLPSFSTETTATLNFLRHKDKAPNNEVGLVYYSDGTEQEIPDCRKETISKYVSTRSDIKVASDVEHLDLFLESKFLEGNVTLIDSPGLNGIKEGHANITANQIKKSSAGIYLFRANQPGTETDFKFLSKLKDNLDNIFFVLNKIDDINEAEGETVETIVESLKENYKEFFKNETQIPEIWPLAAMPALEARSEVLVGYRNRKEGYSEEEKKILLRDSRIEKFEERLLQFLTQGEKAKSMLTAPVEHIKNDFASFNEEYKKELEVFRDAQDTQEIQDEKELIERQIDEINKKLSDSFKDINKKLNEFEIDLKESIKGKFNTLSKKLQNDYIEELYDINELEQFENKIDLKIKKGIEKIVDSVNESFEENLNEIISESYMEFADDINQNLMDTRFSINIKTYYEPTIYTYTNALKEYDSEINKLKEEKEKLVEEINQNKVSRAKAIVKQKKVEELKEKINETEQHQRNFKRDFMNEKPEAEYEERRIKKGVLGKMKEFLIGGEERGTKKVLINEGEIEGWKEEMKKANDEYEKEIDELKQKLNNLKYEDGEIEEIDSINENKEKKTQMIINEIEEIEKKKKQKLLDENASFIRKKRRNIDEYIEEISDQCLEEFRSDLKDKKRYIIDTIQKIVASELNLELEAKSNKLKDLEIKLGDSIEEKEKHIKDIEKKISIIQEILEMAIELKSQLDSIETNTIQKINLN